MTLRTRVAGLAIVLAVAAIPASAQSKAPAEVTAESVTKGQVVFKGAGLCYACHGSEAQGSVGPKLVDHEFIHSKGTYPEIVAYIKTGVTKEESKSGIPMPPRGGSGISDDDVNLVAAYVWSVSHGGAKN
jgi:mono/diheme cytochrome c family protein